MFWNDIIFLGLEQDTVNTDWKYFSRFRGPVFEEGQTRYH